MGLTHSYYLLHVMEVCRYENYSLLIIEETGYSENSSTVWEFEGAKSMVGHDSHDFKLFNRIHIII